MPPASEATTQAFEGGTRKAVRGAKRSKTLPLAPTLLEHLRAFRLQGSAGQQV
jgi:hypothetical protein